VLDGPKHRIKIPQNLVSRNPEHPDAILTHPPVAGRVPRRPLPVNLAIDFNHQARCGTEEVGNIRADRLLATELQAVQSTPAKP